MTNKPNIILIYTDQQRLDSLGCYGSKIARSPNIDSLAADGVLFENNYTVYPVCTPARASLQTGLYPCNHGMQNNMYQPGCVVHELTDSPLLLSRQLQKQHYSAGHTGKWHLGFGSASHNDPWYKTHNVEGSLNTVEYPSFYRAGSSLPTDLGYEADDFPGHGGGGHNYKQYQDYLEENNLEHRLKDENSSTTEVLSSKESTIDYFLTERSIHFIDKFHHRRSPFYFELNYWGPHQPAYVPSTFYDRYRDMKLDPWVSFDEDQKDKPSIHNMARNTATWEEFNKTIKHVYAYGEFIDDEIGRLLTYLKQEDLYDSSYIIFSCDHGDSLGCHAGLGDKGFHMYEETTHIPLIIKPPKGTKHRKKVNEFVNTTDLYSTILDISGVIKEEHERDGRSLLSLMDKEAVPDWPDCVVTEFTGLGYATCSQRMIRFGEYKYIFNAGDKGELYNLSSDPHEINNLHEDSQFKLTRKNMQDKLYQCLKENGDGFANSFKQYIKAEKR
ncbi:MAG: sulfatase-like hydrolase/transferase [Spirochaetaceae bacterium]